jgi:heme-degrading monooxygenase HmoA
MFVHVTTFYAPVGQMANLREMIAVAYLPLVRSQPGFVRDYLLEKVDDPDRAQLIAVWENQTALEDFRNSQTMNDLDAKLREGLPGLRLQSESYIVRLRPGEQGTAHTGG